MGIGENIRKTRLAAGITQGELAAMVNTSQSMIAQYESGKRTPKLDNLMKIAHSLGCSVSDLDSESNWLDYPNRQFEAYEIAQRLVFLREDFEISIEEASKILNIAPAILEEYEDGKTAVPVESLLKIGELYDEYLLEYKEQRGEDQDYRRIEADIKYFYEAYDFENISLLANELRLSDSEEKLLYHFLILNDLGKKVAIERVAELTEIPRYKKEKPIKPLGII